MKHELKNKAQLATRSKRKNRIYEEPVFSLDEDIKMGNQRKAKYQKSVSKRIRSIRKKISFRDEEPDDPAFNQNEESIRIIVSTSAIQSIATLVSNHTKRCKNVNIRLLGSKTNIKFSCTTCGRKFQIRKDNPKSHRLNISDSIAAGALCSGIGYASIKTLFASMEVCMIAKKTYEAAETRVGEELEKNLKLQCIMNGRTEKDLAIAAGDVIQIGEQLLPFVNVTVDAGWGKRSYGHSYNSNAGVAVIIGSRTKKLLYIDYRIKSCIICDKYPIEDNELIPDHNCYKNWRNSSQSMEADIIVKGFKKSIEDHGLLYRYLVGDADSSVYARVQSEVVYPGRVPVEKIDCINHAVRGLNSVLHRIVGNTAFALRDRKLIEMQINRYGRDTRAAITYNHQNRDDITNPTTAKSLYEDIVNIPAHVHGDHSNCKRYFCSKEGTEENKFECLRMQPAGKELLAAFHRLANRSQRLIYNITSNFAESFMGVMAKIISGKRINYAQRGGYSRRMMSAAIGFNSGAFWLPIVYQGTQEHNCPDIWMRTAQYFQKSKLRGPKYPKDGPFRQRAVHVNLKPSSDYGPSANQGQLNQIELQLAVDGLINSLQVTASQRDDIQNSTVGQSFNWNWKFERRNRFTASNSGRAFKLQDHTNNKSILKSIIYPPDLSKNPNILNGINLEPEAKRYYSIVTGTDVQECGLFIYLKNGILAASPDGLIGGNGIIEIKCINCRPEDVPNRPDKFLLRKNNNSLYINKSHKYFFQIVMQLYVAEKKFCDFFVYYKPKNDNEELEYYLERIEKDEFTDQLWVEMELKLIKFFKFDMAPELVDQQFGQTQRFRIPDYRQQAILEHNRQKLATEERKLARKLTRDQAIAARTHPNPLQIRHSTAFQSLSVP